MDFLVLFICLCCSITVVLADTEPTCHSRFDYEYKVIQRLVDLERDIHAQKQDINKLETDLKDIKTARPQIAFTATLSKDLTSFPHNTAIVFDAIITNIGNAYNPANGIFTCKQPGVYVFYWVTTNRDNTYMDTRLVLNGENKGTAFSDSGDHSDYTVASNTVILDLKFGDLVWVKSSTWHNGKMAGDWRSSFTGWIMHG